jgi:hypothetical protein
MADSRLSVGDRVMLGISVTLAVTGLATVVTGVAMFWGELRQVLLAPVAIALGVAAYVAARALWWTVKQAPSRGAH